MWIPYHQDARMGLTMCRWYNGITGHSKRLIEVRFHDDAPSLAHSCPLTYTLFDATHPTSLVRYERTA